MAELEENFLSGYPYKPLNYYRYIDDIFIIWSHVLDLLHNFFNIIINQHSSIIFTSNISTTSVNFPDVTIDLHGGHISTKTYTKSTDTHAFLSYNSFHSRHIKQSIIYSQFTRYKRISSNDDIFLNDATKLFKYFLARQYPFSNILHHFNKVKDIDRHKLLLHTPKQQHSNICLITKFSPKIDIFIQSTKSNYSILKNDGKIGGIFVQPPIYACKQPPNLRNLLIRNTITDDEPECNKPCGKNRCKVCTHINTATNVLITRQLSQAIIAVILLMLYILFIAKNAQKHYILEKLAVISDTDLIITHTLSDRKSFFRCHCISMQMITTLTISKFAF